MEYIDITEKYQIKQEYKLKKQKYFIDDNGVKYNVDGKHVIFKPTKREIEVAKILGKAFGGEIIIIPRVNEPPNVKTPDYLINGVSFDLKGIEGSGKNTIDNSIRKQQKQANNFIFDISKTKMKMDYIIKQIKNIYKSEHRYWVKQIIVIKNQEIIKIYKRI